MAVVLVTGSAGLIGSECSRFFHERGFDIAGIDNDLRASFFGAEASTSGTRQELCRSLPRYAHADLDIRDFDRLKQTFQRYGQDIALVVHTAAQPSHDWAAREPHTDFGVNALGTLNVLEATRAFCPDAVFIFTSTNKVYGDAPNYLPLRELESRWEVAPEHPFAVHGIDETMSIDQTMHSLFGASKVAADVLVQEYGRYFGLRTTVFRGGCLTGPSHAAVELHGFLGYLVRCAVEQRPYTIFGYAGKQVRDNIHSADLVSAFWHCFQSPKAGAVYNMGGSRYSHTSVLEAIDLIESRGAGRVPFKLSPEARRGDHIWYVSDVRRFQQDYPAWKYEFDLTRIVDEIIEACRRSR
jgi:CDP-paratose 2-epimerase